MRLQAQITLDPWASLMMSISAYLPQFCKGIIQNQNARKALLASLSQNVGGRGTTEKCRCTLRLNDHFEIILQKIILYNKVLLDFTSNLTP